MIVISCRVIPAAGYVMNVCNLGKGERQSSDERLYSKRSKGGRGFKVSKRFTMKQKLEWHATWLQQKVNG